MKSIVSLSIAAFFLASACTDVDLKFPQTEEPPEVRIEPNRIKGTFCTEDPSTLVFPVKIWMAIDDTGSMCPHETQAGPQPGNDPTGKRFQAARDLANALNNPGKVFFGGNIFSRTTGQIDFLNGPSCGNNCFTDDAQQFISAVDSANKPCIGGTPYLDTIEHVKGVIDSDRQIDPAVAKRTRYIVIFLSDGKPDPDEATVDIVNKVKSMMDLRAFVGEITLNTVFLGNSEAIAAAVEKLQAMAAEGGPGIYIDFPAGATIDFTKFDFSAIRRAYNQQRFMVYNRSMLPTGEGPKVDSDADGLSDEFETKRGMNPSKRDSDDDGCNDFVEINAGWDPVKKKAGECTCGADEIAKDEDNDKLNNCEEKWMSTLPEDVDSDRTKDGPGDLVLDEWDLLYLSDPKGLNLVSDQDSDGVLDVTELQQHTSPKDDEGPNRSKWAYVYQVKSRPDDTRCSDFVIDNFILGETLAAEGRAAGENLLEFYIAQSPQDNSTNERTFRLGRKIVPYAIGGATVSIARDDFSEVLISGGGASENP